MSADYDGQQVVGLDLHRRRTVMVRMTPQGGPLEQVRFSSDREMLARQITKAGPEPEVVLEATYGWYWAADLLAEAGARVHLAHPLGVKGFSYRRVKNDVRDAADLADLLRMGRLPEAWLAPPRVRELRELVRHRHKLRDLLVLQGPGPRGAGEERAGCLGVRPVRVTGRARLAELALPPGFAERLASQLRVVDLLEAEILGADRAVAARLKDESGYRAIQRIPGVGPVLAAVFVAEIGDVARFRSPAQLCSWAGLTPRHRESDTRCHRGSITKQGSRLVRWAAVESVQRAPARTPMRTVFDRIVERRGVAARHVARVAAARVLLELTYYGLRDGHLRRPLRSA